jgi:hypothetical protein
MPWIFVIGKLESAEWILKNGRMAFKPGVRFSLIEKGDPFVIYGYVMTFEKQIELYPQIVATGVVTESTITAPIEVAGKVYSASGRLDYVGSAWQGCAIPSAGARDAVHPEQACLVRLLPQGTQEVARRGLRRHRRRLENPLGNVVTGR